MPFERVSSSVEPRVMSVDVVVLLFTLANHEAWHADYFMRLDEYVAIWFFSPRLAEAGYRHRRAEARRCRSFRTSLAVDLALSPAC